MTSRQAFNIDGITESAGFSSWAVLDMDSVEPGEIRRKDDLYSEWLGSGMNGTMAWMLRHKSTKYRPQELLGGVRSILFVAVPYFQKRDEPHGARIARYAWGRDYHTVLKDRLAVVVDALGAKASASTRSFVDTLPIDERFFAQKAGLGFIGKHGLLITKEYGSWCVLGGILSTAPLTTSRKPFIAHCPSSCRRCINVCPGGALDNTPVMDPRRCIAYMNIEHKGILDEGSAGTMGEHAFGCDLCQEVCPFNVGVEPVSAPEFLKWIAGPTMDLADMLGSTEADFRLRFSESPLGHAGYSRVLRSACLVAGNTARTDLAEPIGRLCSASDSGVAAAARWARARLARDT